MKKLVAVLLLVCVMSSALLLTSCGNKTNMDKLITAVDKEEIALGDINDLTEGDIFYYKSGEYSDLCAEDFTEIYSFISHCSKPDSLTVESQKWNVKKAESFERTSGVIEYWSENEVMDVELRFYNKSGYWIDLSEGKAKWLNTEDFKLYLDDVDFNAYADDGILTADDIKDCVNTSRSTVTPDDELLDAAASFISESLNNLNSVTDAKGYPILSDSTATEK